MMGNVGQRDQPAQNPVREVATLFLKLGLIAFGGPAAHVALMREEVVRRRAWLTDQQFLDLFAAANLIPGPSSTELAIFLGYRRAGPIGLVLGGGLFILPAMAIVLVLAILYVRFGSYPQATWVLYGIKPVIIAVIAQALWGLGRTALKTAPLIVLGCAVIALYFLGISVIVLLLGSGVICLLVKLGRERVTRPPLFFPPLVPLAAVGDAAKGTVGILPIFLEFLKLGSVVFGSGYVLLAFLRADLVGGLSWLTDQQILDAVAVGQLTPGPVFTTATFLGYLLGGVPGAVVATVGIFLPGFVLVALIYPYVTRIRESPAASAFLDGVNVAAVGLMTGVSWDLGRASIVDAPTIVIVVVAAVLLIRFRVNSAWLVVGGGVVGVLARMVTG